MKNVLLDYLNDYNIDEVRDSIEKAFTTLGITSKFRSKMTVLIKVCLPSPTSQDLAESTNPAVVRAVVDYLSSQGVKCIVADSPVKKHSLTYLNEVYFNTGMLEVANLTKCTLNRDLSTSNVEIPDGVMAKSAVVLDVINKVDAVINIGKLKIDNDFGYFGACSNYFGLIPGEMKSLILNRMGCLCDYNNYIIDLIETFKDKVVVNILDAIVALEAGSTQRMLNCLAISEDSYALDAAMFDILDITYEHTLLKQSSERGLINLSKPYKLVGEKIEKFKLEDFGMVDFDCRKVLSVSNSYFKSHQQRPTINKNKCKGCSICSKICPTNAIVMKYDKNNELYSEIDYSKCIFCNKCINACPYSAVEQKTPLAFKKIQKALDKYNNKES